MYISMKLFLTLLSSMKVLDLVGAVPMMELSWTINGLQVSMGYLAMKKIFQLKPYQKETMRFH